MSTFLHNCTVPLEFVERFSIELVDYKRLSRVDRLTIDDDAN